MTILLCSAVITNAFGKIPGLMRNENLCYSFSQNILTPDFKPVFTCTATQILPDF